MDIIIFPCQGRCNVSMMTKTVAEYFVDDEKISVQHHINLPLENGSQYIALNGCPAKCASKEFETLKIKGYEEIIITKNFDPKNNEKYKELLDIDEEVSLVQEAFDRLLGSI